MEALAGELTAVAMHPPAFSRILFHNQFPLVFLEFLISPFLLALSPLLKITFKAWPFTKKLFWKRNCPSLAPHPHNYSLTPCSLASTIPVSRKAFGQGASSSLSPDIALSHFSSELLWWTWQCPKIGPPCYKCRFTGPTKTTDSETLRKGAQQLFKKSLLVISMHANVWNHCFIDKYWRNCMWALVRLNVPPLVCNFRYLLYV